MTQLALSLRGYEFEIVCGQFPQSAFDQLEIFRRENRLSLKEIFYLNDELIREKAKNFPWQDWRSLGTFYHGISIDMNAVTFKKAALSLNGSEVEMDTGIISIKHEAPLTPPIPDDGFLTLTGGAVHICRMQFVLDIDVTFDIQKLVFVLKDFTSLGIETDQLVRIEYGGHPMLLQVSERKAKGMLDVVIQPKNAIS